MDDKDLEMHPIEKAGCQKGVKCNVNAKTENPPEKRSYCEGAGLDVRGETTALFTVNCTRSNSDMITVQKSMKLK